MKTKFLIFSLFLISSFGFSQNIQIKGKVVDAANGIPIPGANITNKNSATSVSTDLDGNFKLSPFADFIVEDL
jgi:hypothetical protein